TDAEGRRLFTSLQQQFLNMVRGRPGQLPPPVDSMEGRWDEAERAHVERMTRVSAVGSPGAVREGLSALLSQTGADGLMLTAHISAHRARRRSSEWAPGACREINGTRRGGAGSPRPRREAVSP